jgi:AAA+ superfamily predicted ATPase
MATIADEDSADPDDLQRAREEMAAAKRVVEWSCVRGLRMDGEDDAASANPERALIAIREVVEEMARESAIIREAKDNLEARCEAEGRQVTEEDLKRLPGRSVPPTVFVLKDFQPYLKIPNVCGWLFDLSIAAQEEPAWLMVVSPRTDVPEELQDTITVLDYDLPDRDHLSGLVQNLADDLELQIPDDLTVRAADALAGLTDMQASNALALSFVKTQEIHLGAMLEEKTRSLSQSGKGVDILDTSESLTLAELKGMEVLADWLIKRLESLTDQAARDYGLPVPKGPLLIGPPGVGKTALAKAAGAVRGLPVVIVKLGELYDSSVGGSEANVAALFRLLKAAAPVIVLLDELEKLMSMSMGASSGDSGTSARVNATFLTELNEMTEEVFVIGTVNDVGSMRPEMMRKGRWGDVFLLDLPPLAARQDIFAVHLARKKRDPRDFDLAELGAISEGFSGAEIEGAVISALYDAYHDGKREITHEDLRQAVKDTAPLSKTAGEEIEAMRNVKGIRRAGLAEVKAPGKRKGGKGRFEGVSN